MLQAARWPWTRLGLSVPQPWLLPLASRSTHGLGHLGCGYSDTTSWVLPDAFQGFCRETGIIRTRGLVGQGLVEA